MSTRSFLVSAALGGATGLLWVLVWPDEWMVGVVVGLLLFAAALLAGLGSGDRG